LSSMSCVSVCVCATRSRCPGVRLSDLDQLFRQLLNVLPVLYRTTACTHTWPTTWLAGGGRDSVRVALHSTSDDRPSRQRRSDHDDRAGRTSVVYGLQTQIPFCRQSFCDQANHHDRACCAFALRALERCNWRRRSFMSRPSLRNAPTTIIMRW
jgi:hypothetical protein